MWRVERTAWTWEVFIPADTFDNYGSDKNPTFVFSIKFDVAPGEVLRIFLFV